MATRFMTDPHAMRDMAGRFEVHAQTVEDEARRMWASPFRSDCCMLGSSSNFQVWPGMAALTRSR